jgi:hypothetical protein
MIGAKQFTLGIIVSTIKGIAAWYVNSAQQSKKTAFLFPSPWRNPDSIGRRQEHIVGVP